MLLFTALHTPFAKLAAAQLLHPALRCAFCSCGWSSCFAVRFGADTQLLMCKHNESVYLSKAAVNSNFIISHSLIKSSISLTVQKCNVKIRNSSDIR